MGAVVSMRVLSRLGLGVLLAAAGLQCAEAGKDQSEYAVTSQINIAHTGNIDFAAGFAPPLVKAWTADLGVDQNILFQPLIAQNSVFLNANGVEIFALDLATGKQKWSHALPCCSEQGTYDHGKLFFLSFSGLVTALSAKTGEELWHVQLTGESSFPVAPIASKGQVFANGEGGNGIAYSLRETDGKLLWTQNLPSAGLASLGGGGLFVTSSCFYSRLSPVDGTLLWSGGQCVGGGPDASAYFKKRLYATGYDAGNIIDAADGTLVGTFPAGGTPAMFTLGHKNFGVAQDGDSTLGCWNAATGKPVWEFTAAFEIQTAPIVVNGVVYATDALANLYALNPENGKKIWSDNVGDLGYAPILSAGQGTLVLANDTKIIAYRPQ